ncbi:MAG: AAA family ATPase [Endomicrobia bacterium]|nr:AAA family ATPase [Endomicrobiia bacterium]
MVVLTGMRQVGKTTLIKKFFETINSDNKIYFDLENPINQKVFEEKNYDNILANFKEFGVNPKKKLYVFIDEVQYMPEIIKVIKYLYDNYKIKFF